MRKIEPSIKRILDANINRSLEGLRVLEETSRMVLDDIPLTATLKELRHEISAIFMNLPSALLLSARDSENDILSTGETLSESTRTNLESVVRANARRSQEAVRALEEYSKLVLPGVSERLKSVRFRLYASEKKLIERIARDSSVISGKLVLILESTSMSEESIDWARRLKNSLGDHAMIALVAGPGQSMEGREFMDRARILVRQSRESDIRVFIRRRIDMALILGTDGVLLDRRGGISPDEVRASFPQEFILGYILEGDEDFSMVVDRLTAVNMLIIGRSRLDAVEKVDEFEYLRTCASSTVMPVIVTPEEHSLNTIRRCINAGAAGLFVNSDMLDAEYNEVLTEVFAEHDGIL